MPSGPIGTVTYMAVFRPVVGCVGAVLALGVLGGASRAAAVNLLQNPGAEAGAGAADNTVVAVPGWTTTASFTAVVYGIPGFPLASEGAPAGGVNFFAGGPDASLSTATQVVDVSASAAQIDAGQLQAHLSG